MGTGGGSRECLLALRVFFHNQKSDLELDPDGGGMMLQTVDFKMVNFVLCKFTSILKTEKQEGVVLEDERPGGRHLPPRSALWGARGAKPPERARSRCPLSSASPVPGLGRLQPAVREKILATLWNFFFYY